MKRGRRIAGPVQRSWRSQADVRDRRAV